MINVVQQPCSHFSIRWQNEVTEISWNYSVASLAIGVMAINFYLVFFLKRNFYLYAADYPEKVILGSVILQNKSWRPFPYTQCVI